MTLLTILHHPDPRLRKKAAAVNAITPALQQTLDDMLETMYAAPGIGLAATQVNVHQRMIVMDISENKDQPLFIINPEILHKEGTIEYEEGCLSVPEYYDKVTRAEKIRVRFLNREGQTVELEAEGLLAICIQHEMDHLEGKLFVDYLSTLKQQRVRKKLEKLAKNPAPAKTPDPEAQAVNQ
ncbi:peptide deformylase [Thiofilum flexile]|uniref:peptide deformylase n=1 Tax=Thiofilum flexile TaxID=125627 RepID=UPI00036F9A0F|nr:peptide deformylase [Thiofilum flexile]